MINPILLSWLKSIIFTKKVDTIKLKCFLCVGNGRMSWTIKQKKKNVNSTLFYHVSNNVILYYYRYNLFSLIHISFHFGKKKLFKRKKNSKSIHCILLYKIQQEIMMIISFEKRKNNVIRLLSGKHAKKCACASYTK